MKKSTQQHGLKALLALALIGSILIAWFAADQPHFKATEAPATQSAVAPVLAGQPSLARDNRLSPPDQVQPPNLPVVPAAMVSGAALVNPSQSPASSGTPNTPAGTLAPVQQPPPAPWKSLTNFDPAEADATGQWFHPDLPENVIRSAMAEFYQQRSQANKQRALNLAQQHGWPLGGTLPDGSVIELIGVDDQDQPLYRTTTNDRAAITTGAAQIRSTAPYNLTGKRGTTPLNIGVWDGGSVRASHQEFPSSAAVIKNASADVEDHPTHVAGTIGARGTRSQARGMAPEAKILSYDWDDDTSEMTLEAAASASYGTKILISNHSYGLISGWYRGTSPMSYFGRYPAREDEKFGQYSSNTRTLDVICANNPYYLPFWANGNDRDDAAPSSGTTFRYLSGSSWTTKSYSSSSDPYSDGYDNGGFDTLGPEACFKNGMSIGAVTAGVNSSGSRSPSSSSMSSFSGWGPTDDGRIKPDLVAKGVDVYSPISTSNSAYDSWAGTSMATPNAAGSALLLQELYAENFNGEAMRASMLKALLIHTADDVNNPGPDYRTGWGMMNVKRAADLILAHRASPVIQTLATGRLVTGDATDTYTFQWDGVSPLRATLCWTDPAGTAKTGLDNTSRALVNDLDIRLARSGGSTHQPYTLSRSSPANNATTGDNIVDPVEQIFVASPSTGTYTLTVSHKGSLSGGGQTYSLVLSGHRASGNSPVLALSTNSLSVTTAVGTNPAAQSFTVRNAGAGNLSYSISDDASWITVSPTSGDSTGEADTIQVTFSTTSLQSGSYTGRITVSAPGQGVQEVTVSLLVGGNNASLLTALDLPNGTPLTNSGAVPWLGQTLNTQDGVDAGRSGVISHSQESGVSMTVTGPGTLSFWWRTDSEATFDWLRFELNGVKQAEISGNTAWTERTYTLAAGTQTLRWNYIKDTSVNTGADAGFLDRVNFVSNLPRIELSNVNLSVNAVQGTNPAAQTLGIRNVGGGTLSYSLTETSSWLTLSPTSGSSTGETDSINLTFSTASLTPGLYAARITASGSGVTSVSCDVNLTITSNSSSISLAQALDATPAPAWTTTSSSGDGGWFGQSTLTKDGVDAARSGLGLPDNATSSLSVTLTGPTTVSFWWRTDSEPNYDFLNFQIDGVTQSSISGATTWAQKSFSIPAGSHTLRWLYEKDGSVTTGQDAGFVDSVSFSGNVAQILLDTSTLTASATQGTKPADASFTLRNGGTGTLAYTLSSNVPWLTLSTASGTCTTETDRITARFTTQPLPAGTHNANITISAGLAGSVTLPVEVTINPVTLIPVQVTDTTAYTQNFTAGIPSLSQGWQFRSTAEGRIQVLNGVLRLDDYTPGSEYSLNEAILHANLSGKSRVVLSFRHREDADEDHEMPTSFNSQHDSDGVAISGDGGTTWHRIETLAGTAGAWTNYVVNLDTAIANAGISYSSSFQIKFQQYDDYSNPVDGFDFDDITLRINPPGTDDHGNSTSLATTLPLATPGNGIIERAGDLDYFRIVVPQDGTLSVVSSGSTDVMGDLYNSTGALLTTNDDDGPSLNFLVSFPVSTGTYFLRVRGFGTNTGAYGLGTSFTPFQRLTPIAQPSSGWSKPTMNGFAPNFTYRITMKGMIASGYGASLNAIGQISLTISIGGAFTGTIELENGSWPFRGSFTTSGGVASWSGSIPRTQASTLNLNLSFASADDLEWRLRGTLNDGLNITELDLFENYNWNSGYAGKYTFAILHENNGSSAEPQGDGYGTVTVNNTGDATVQVVLPDGTRFTEPAFLTFETENFEPDVQIFRSLYTRPKGHFAAIYRYRFVPGVSHFDGFCHWVKPQQTTGNYYRDGFRLNRPIIGNYYLPRGTNLPELPNLVNQPINAQAQWLGGNFTLPAGIRTLTWSPNDSVRFITNGETISLTVTPATGMVSGNFRDPRTGITFTYGGVILQLQGLVSGHLMGRNEAGSFLLRPKP